MLAALLVAVSAPTCAQFGGGGSGGMGGMSGMGGGGGGGGGRRSRGGGDGTETSAVARPQDLASAAAQLRERLLDLRLQLMITPAQSAAWARFSDAVWALAGHRNIRPATPPDGENAAAAFRLRAQQAEQTALRLQALSTATDQLYALLTPEQQRLADPQLIGALP